MPNPRMLINLMKKMGKIKKSTANLGRKPLPIKKQFLIYKGEGQRVKPLKKIPILDVKPIPLTKYIEEETETLRRLFEEVRKVPKKIPYEKWAAEIEGVTPTKLIPAIEPSLAKEVTYSGLQEGLGGKPGWHVFTNHKTQSTFMVPVGEDVNVGIREGLQRLKKTFEGGNF